MQYHLIYVAQPYLLIEPVWNRNLRGGAWIFSDARCRGFLMSLTPIFFSVFLCKVFGERKAVKSGGLW